MSSDARPKNVQAAFNAARAALKAGRIRTPDLDAALLLEAATGVTALQRITHPDLEISEKDWQSLAGFIDRRANHEPLHRIVGSREFYSLSLEIDESTLVPRPDTEILVDAVLPFIKQCADRKHECQILDLGTGSGAIALALLHQEERAHIIATDISNEALKMAAKNAHRLGLQDRFTTLRSNWFAAVTGKFDLIVSNPPYIATKIIETLDKEVRDYDPTLALDGGVDGLSAYKIIAQHGSMFLNDGGRIAVEIGYDQKSAVCALFETVGLRCIDALDDLSGQNRVLFFAIS